ncbi:MAG: transporter substrate-binding domain-containing protein [Oscillospiraceae bacterium]|jgi:putative lysine transport system substrate-binding protein|nr:transporter substrate-binding domain-containing protein [Oscillospiraceae bacterium]
MKKFLALAMAFVMLFGLASCTGGEDDTTTTQGAKKEQLRVGLECAYAPFNWTQLDSGNGAVKIDGQSSAYAAGYDIEIAKIIAEKLDRELVIVKTSWDGLIPAVQSGVIDLVIAGMSPTEERKLEIDFTNSYYTSKHVIIVNADGALANATGLADFAGKKITGQLGTVHYDLIDQIEGVKKETAMEDFAAMRIALESGVIDGYVSEYPEGLSAELANSKFKMIVFEDGKGFDVKPEDKEIAVGLKKGSELVDQINTILAGITAEQRQTFMDNAVQGQGSAVEDEDLPAEETSAAETTLAGTTAA